MESNIINVESTLHDNEESDDFLTSDKRLFNRRGSSDTGEENEHDLSSTSLNVHAPIFVPQQKTHAIAITVTEASLAKLQQERQPRRKKSSSSKRHCLYCKRKGRDPVTVATHNMRNSSTGEIICPYLLENM